MNLLMDFCTFVNGLNSYTNKNLGKNKGTLIIFHALTFAGPGETV